MSHALLMRWFSVLFALMAVPAVQAVDVVVTPAMIGHWEGRARIIVSWCSQQQLPVAIDIHADGSVTGKVGDAELTQGRFSLNRGWLGRLFNFATDYIVQGDLQGPVVAAEGISRAAVSMPLRFVENSFKGGIHTSGSKFGGKENMILSAMSLQLIKRE